MMVATMMMMTTTTTTMIMIMIAEEITESMVTCAKLKLRGCVRSFMVEMMMMMTTTTTMKLMTVTTTTTMTTAAEAYGLHGIREVMKKTGELMKIDWRKNDYT